MLETLFTIQLFTSMLALALSYSLIMALLKREVNQKHTRILAIAMLMSAGTTLGLSYGRFFETFELFVTSSALFLVLGLGLSLAIVSLHRIKVGEGSAYPEGLLKVIRNLTYAVFVSFLLHMLLEVAAVAGF